MEPKIAVFALVFLLFFSPFSTVSGDPVQSHGPIVYSRDQLLALRSTAVLPHERPDVPRELKRRRRGSRAGADRRARRRIYRPVLPSIIMGNVRSLPNKMDELAALTRHQREYRACSIMMFTETWLTTLTPDTAAALDGFKLLRADRTRESGKRKGGGLAVFVNDRWCNPGHITIKEQLCCGDIELLAVSMRPYYLPREFSHVIAIAAYIPPLLTRMQPVMFSTLLQAGCRQSTHRPSFLSLGTLIMPLHPPLCPLSPSTLHVAPETIRHWICVMPTPRRHTLHHPSPPWEDLTTTWFISCLCTNLSCTGNQLCPAQ